MSKLVAALDDEPDIIELLRVNLTRYGFAFEGFVEVGDFLNFVSRKKPGLIILDLMLPDMDGVEVFRNLKKDASLARVPVIMLTARGGEADKVLGLELGADDYVTKPFSVRELAARIKAVLRRAEGEPAVKAVELGELVIEPESHGVRAGGRPVELTATEFKILELLASRPGRVFTRSQILDHLWGDEKVVVDRTIDVHIRNLRDKLGTAGGYVVSVRGVGYKIVVPSRNGSGGLSEA